MGSHELKNALRDRGLTPEEFADIIQVDPKSVTRWLSGAATPYPRHRARIARALDLAEHDLWPETVKPAHNGSAGAEVNEVTGAWAYSDQESAPNPVAFVTTSTGPIDLLSTAHGIEINLQLVSALLEQADTGRPIRVITQQRDPKLLALLEHPQIQMRYLPDVVVDHSIIQAGDIMLFTFVLRPERQDPPALLKLNRSQDDGLFDRLTDSFTGLWGEAVQTITTPDQLQSHVPRGGGDEDLHHHEQQTGEQNDPDKLTARDPAQRTDDQAQPPPAGDTQPPLPPRRWPRRPE